MLTLCEHLGSPPIFGGVRVNPIINNQIAAMKDVIQVEANTEDDAALKQLDNLRVAKEDVKSTDMNIDKKLGVNPSVRKG
jgi:hypothetical protein